MALVVYDRVQETTATTGTGSITLAGAVAGYQSFAVVGNTNTTFYCIVNNAAWEVGIGTYSTTGPTLARTTVLSNSNGTTSPITLVGASNVFCTYPSEKSVNLDASGNVTPLGTISSGTWQGTTVGVAYGGTGVTTSTGANSNVLRDANSNITTNNVLNGYTAVVSAGGTTVLTAASAYYQRLTGTLAQTFQLPNATTLPNGTAYAFDNDSTGVLTITNNASATVDTVAAGAFDYIYLLDNSTSAGSWGSYSFIPAAYDFSNSTASFGNATITNATWNGNAISSGYGGTGLTTFTAANYALYSTSASALTAGTLPVAAGGTGITTLTSGYIPFGNGTAALGSSSSLTWDGTTLSATKLAGAFNGTVGATTANAGTFTTLGGTTITASTQFTGPGTGLTGTASSLSVGGSAGSVSGPVAATTLSASGVVSGVGFSNYLASPPAIGSGTANTGAFTTLSASSTVSGVGFSNYLASPPAIGGTAAAAGTFTTLNATSIGATTAGTGAFTTLSASSTVSGVGFSNYLASPPAIGGTAPSTGKFTTLSISGTGGVTFPDSTTQNTGAFNGGLAFRNRIINGGMDFAQRGTSFSTPASGSYTLDRWFVSWTGAAPATVAQVAGPTGFRNALRITGAASNTAVGIIQKIESYNCSDLSGANITIQANIAVSSAQTVQWILYYPTAQDNYTSQTQIATGTWSATTTATTFTATITGLPSGATNGLQLSIYPNAIGAFTSGTITITGVQLEKSPTATAFDYRPYGTELMLCQRYFETSYNAGVTVGTASLLGASTTVPSTYATLFFIVFKASKRVTPTMTVYSTFDGSSGNCSLNNTSNVAIVGFLATGMCESFAYHLNLSNAVFYMQWTASAEL